MRRAPRVFFKVLLSKNILRGIKVFVIFFGLLLLSSH